MPHHCRIADLPDPCRDEVRAGFLDATRGHVGQSWTDSASELREHARTLRGDLDAMLRWGNYEEGEAEACAYAIGRDMGLAWARRKCGR